MLKVFIWELNWGFDKHAGDTKCFIWKMLFCAKGEIFCFHLNKYISHFKDGLRSLNANLKTVEVI